MKRFFYFVANAVAAAGAFSFAYGLVHPPLGKFGTFLLTVIMVTIGVEYLLKAVKGESL